MLRPKLFELCDNFDQLTLATNNQKPIVQHLEDTIKKNQRRDLFNLGVLFDSILGIDKLSLSKNNDTNIVNAISFISACKSAKSVEDLLDHKYLIHGIFSNLNFIVYYILKNFFILM